MATQSLSTCASTRSIVTTTEETLGSGASTMATRRVPWPDSSEEEPPQPERLAAKIERTAAARIVASRALRKGIPDSPSWDWRNDMRLFPCFARNLTSIFTGLRSRTSTLQRFANYGRILPRIWKSTYGEIDLASSQPARGRIDVGSLGMSSRRETLAVAGNCHGFNH